MPKALAISDLSPFASKEQKSRFEDLAARRGMTLDAAMCEATQLWIDVQADDQFFKTVRQHVDWDSFDSILSNFSRGEPPQPDDELPANYKRQTA